MSKRKTTKKLRKTPRAIAFGEALKSARKAEGITQVELAQRLRIDDPLNVSRWESGRNLPSDDNLDSLARVFPDLVARHRSEAALLKAG